MPSCRKKPYVFGISHETFHSFAVTGLSKEVSGLAVCSLTTGLPSSSRRRALEISVMVKHVHGKGLSGNELFQCVRHDPDGCIQSFVARKELELAQDSGAAS